MTARLLHAAHRALDAVAGGVVVVSEWFEVAAYRAANDQRGRVAWLDEPHLVPRPGPLDPDGYRVDGTHCTEEPR